MAKYNLNESILDAEGHPMPDKSITIHPLVKPKEVEVYAGSGEKTRNMTAVAVLEQKPKLTYSRAIRLALKEAGNTKDNDLDKLDCADLLFKLVADTDVELSVSERNLAIQSCKMYSDVEAFWRIQKLLDTEGVEDETA